MPELCVAVTAAVKPDCGGMRLILGYCRDGFGQKSTEVGITMVSFFAETIIAAEHNIMYCTSQAATQRDMREDRRSMLLAGKSEC